MVRSHHAPQSAHQTALSVTKNRHGGFFLLFFCLFMLRALFAPIAKFQKFYLPLHFFLIFLAPVVHALAFFTGEFYQPFLTHTQYLISSEQKTQTCEPAHTEHMFLRTEDGPTRTCTWNSGFACPPNLRAMEESNLRMRFWRPPVCHLLNRPRMPHIVSHHFLWPNFNYYLAIYR